MMGQSRTVARNGATITWPLSCSSLLSHQVSRARVPSRYRSIDRTGAIEVVPFGDAPAVGTSRASFIESSRGVARIRYPHKGRTLGSRRTVRPRAPPSLLIETTARRNRSLAAPTRGRASRSPLQLA